MKKHKYSSLEEHIKSELKDYKAPYDSKSWETLKTKLPKNNYSKWYWVAATTIIILSLSTYLFNHKPSVITPTRQNKPLSLTINNTKSNNSILKEDKTIEKTQIKKEAEQNHKKKTIHKDLQKKPVKEQKQTNKSEAKDVKIEKNDSSYIPKTLITEQINKPITNWDLVNISIQEESLCTSSPVYFSIINLPKDCKVSWDFGDNNTATTYNTQHTYENDGEYKINLKIFNNEKQINLQKTISIKKSPSASFYYKQEKNNVIINNTSKNFTNKQWYINGKNISEDSLDNAFQYTGEYTIRLTVKNNNNCSDSYKEIVRYKRNYNIYAPTAFVPNNDGVNDKYMVKYKVLEKYSYNFQIFNNLGVLIFESSEPTANWNGMIGNNLAPKGKYLWKLTITDPQNNIEQYEDYFVLIREN